jgi:hypothetical protein
MLLYTHISSDRTRNIIFKIYLCTPTSTRAHTHTHTHTHTHSHILPNNKIQSMGNEDIFFDGID